MANDVRSVLIVDDEADIRRALKFILEMDGWDVVGEAENGYDALSIAWHLQPACIILDFRLPGMDGEQVAARLRGLAPDSKIIAFSAILEDPPSWADSYLNKERIGHMSRHLHELVS